MLLGSKPMLEGRGTEQEPCAWVTEEAAELQMKNQSLHRSMNQTVVKLA